MALTFKQSYEVYINNDLQSVDLGLCPMYETSEPVATPFSRKEPLCLQLKNGNRILWTTEFVKEFFADQKTTHIWWNFAKLPQQMATCEITSSVCRLNAGTGVLEATINGHRYLVFPPQPVPEENLLTNTVEIPLHYCNTLEPRTAFTWYFPESFNERIEKDRMCPCTYHRWETATQNLYTCIECGNDICRDANKKEADAHVATYGYYCDNNCKLDAERREDEVPCQRCGCIMDIGDQGEYRAGYYCSRSCAFDL